MRRILPTFGNSIKMVGARTSRHWKQTPILNLMLNTMKTALFLKATSLRQNKSKTTSYTPSAT